MAWSNKYKKSINCNNPKGFSQKAHCAGKKKRNENIMKLSELKEQIKNMIQERSINAISKAQQKNASDIEKALDFYKKNKHTDKKDAFIKVLKKLGDEKKKLEKEMDIAVSSKLKNVGLSDKFESVNEISAKKGLEQVIKGNTKQVEGIKVSKEMAQAMLDWFNSSPYGRKYPKAKNSRLHVSIGTMLAFGLDRYAKHKGAKEELKYLKSMKESVNESVNESTGYDSNTGLFYLSGVPFTRERVQEVIRFFQGINVNKYTKSAVNQFEYTPSLLVKDKSGREEVLIDSKKLKMLVSFYKKNSAKLASDKDF